MALLWRVGCLAPHVRSGSHHPRVAVPGAGAGNGAETATVHRPWSLTSASPLSSLPSDRRPAALTAYETATPAL